MDVGYFYIVFLLLLIPAFVALGKPLPILRDHFQSLSFPQAIWRFKIFSALLSFLTSEIFVHDIHFLPDFIIFKALLSLKDSSALV